MKEKTRPTADQCFICGKESEELVEVSGPSGTSVRVCASHPGISAPDPEPEDES